MTRACITRILFSKLAFSAEESALVIIYTWLVSAAHTTFENADICTFYLEMPTSACFMVKSMKIFKNMRVCVGDRCVCWQRSK